jgi:hypothetical protein
MDKKIPIMESIIESKFTQCPHARSLLQATDNTPLIENVPDSTFWGIGHDGKGKNMLGKLLEELRAKLPKIHWVDPQNVSNNISKGQRKPRVLLIGNSQIKEIDADRLTHQATVLKKIAYTIDEASTYMDTLAEEPYDLVILHLITNDVKTVSAEECLEKLYPLIETAKQKSLGPVMLSTLSSRKDSKLLELKTKQVELMLKNSVDKDPNVHLWDNSDLRDRADMDEPIFWEDGVHLSKQGVACFANSLRYGLYNALGIKKRSTSGKKPDVTRSHTQTDSSRTTPKSEKQRTEQETPILPQYPQYPLHGNHGRRNSPKHKPRGRGSSGRRRSTYADWQAQDSRSHYNQQRNHNYRDRGSRSTQDARYSDWSYSWQNNQGTVAPSYLDRIEHSNYVNNQPYLHNDFAQGYRN